MNLDPFRQKLQILWMFGEKYLLNSTNNKCKILKFRELNIAPQYMYIDAVRIT